MMSRLKKPAQAIILMLALLFIFLLLRSQWQELRSYQWHLRPGWLLAAGSAIFASWSIEVSIWRGLLRKMGGQISFGQGFRIWFISALVRYIPGNLWQPLGMTVLSRRHGVRTEATVISIALYQAINLLSVTLIAALYFPLGGNLGLLTPTDDPRLAPLGLLLLAPTIVFILRPGWLVILLNFLLRKLGRPPFPVTLSSADILAALLLGAIDWILLGLGFAALTLALHPLTLPQLLNWLPHLVASYPLAYVIGYLSFITPSGLAVREGALYVLLSPITGGALATVAALAMRVWLMACELIAAGLALATWPHNEPRPWHKT
ncbi:MAG: flippase-like domain-containing protein [Chloroflexi bacterium]|nr:flippase-like domain-containing protein [Chloroflexota bacterium]